MHRIIKPPHRRAAMAATLAIALSQLVSPANAQQPTQAQQNAIRQSCRADYQANCASVAPGGTAALACLQQHIGQLSAPCQNAVSAIGGTSGNAASPATGTQGAVTAPASPPPTAVAPAMSPRQELALLRGYCGADYRRYCRGVRPGGGRALQCLEGHANYLSAGCRRALSQAGR